MLIVVGCLPVLPTSGVDVMEMVCPCDMHDFGKCCCWSYYLVRRVVHLVNASMTPLTENTVHSGVQVKPSLYSVRQHGVHGTTDGVCVSHILLLIFIYRSAYMLHMYIVAFTSSAA